MKKIRIFMVIIMALMMGCSVAYADTYHISGKIIKGRIYLPAYQFGQLGFGVEWNNNLKELTLRRNNQKMIMNKNHYKLIDGRVSFPLSYINKFDGVDVKYDSVSKKAIVSVDEQVIFTPAPNVEPELLRGGYRDSVLSNRVYFSYEKIRKYDMEAYSDYQLARIRIKADYQPLVGSSRDVVTVDQVVETFSKMLKLTPEQLERVGVLDGLMDSRGRIDRHRTISWAELNQVVCSYFEYMGIDPFSAPAHESSYLTIANEHRLNGIEIYNASALKWVGIDAMGEIDYRRGEISIYRGDVDVAGFNALMRQLTMY